MNVDYHLNINFKNNTAYANDAVKESATLLDFFTTF